MDSGKLANGIPAITGLFTWPSEEPALIASRCTGCGTCCFPYVGTCVNPACTTRNVEKTTLSRTGTLWSYTVHHYRPPPPFTSPEPFEPFSIGVVELPEGLKVLGMLVVDDQKSLRIGAAVRLIVDSVGEDEAGNQLLTWKFALCKELADA